MFERERQLDALAVFRAVLLSVMHDLNDQCAFKRFAGLGGDDQVPDRKTLWKCRDLLARSDATEEMFELPELRLGDRAAG